jgi:DNA-binding protein H-NS
VEFFSFDLGGLFVTVVLAPIAWMIKNGIQRGARAREAELDELARANEKRAVEAQERLTAASEREREIAELHEAFAIHESLTRAEVYEAMNLAEMRPASREFLVQLHRRATHRYEQFDDRWPLPSDVQELVRAAVADVARRIPAESAEAQVLFEQKVEQKTLAGDRRTFLVEGRVLSKHHTLHALAVRFARDRGIHTVVDFTREWGAIVTRVIGTSLAPSVFTGKKLLTDPTRGTDSYLKRYAARDLKTLKDLGALELDGGRYMLAWESGVTPSPADIGRALHLPLIEEFASDPKWGVSDVPRGERD